MNENNTNNYNPYIKPVYSPKKPTREYSKAETIIAWVCLLAGYLFCRLCPIYQNPFGAFLFTLALYIGTIILVKLTNLKIKVAPLLAGISAIMLSFSLIVSYNRFLFFFTYLYSLITYCYFVMASFNKSVIKVFNDLFFIDYLKALFELPFTSLDKIFLALFTGKGASIGRFVLKIVIGIAVAVIPTAIVIGLLSYDSEFTRILKNIFDFKFTDIISQISSVVLGIPIGMYIFGLYISSVDNISSDSISVKDFEQNIKKIRIAPAITILIAIIPLLFIYVIFFISQTDYYLSAFTNKLPDGFSYAQYAREGFFQLCTVSIINLVIIIAIILLLKRKNSNVILKILTTVFSFFTLILISTAISKMIMYIDFYGLTQKRVYATWFMILIALVYILIMLKQYIRKTKAVFLSFAVCMIMFSLLSLSNVDGIIARYNINRYLSGTLETVDVEALGDLGYASVEHLVRLEDVLESNNKHNAKILKMKKSIDSELLSFEIKLENENDNLFSFNLQKHKAEKALKSRNSQ